MIIIHDKRDIIDSLGNVVGTETQFLDTSNPAVLAMLQSINGNHLAQQQAGYSDASRIGGTRWSQIVKAAHSPTADPDVLALNLQ